MCEQDIIQNDRRMRHLSDRMVALEAEKKNLFKVVDQHSQLIDTLENVLVIVDRLMNRTNELSLQETAKAFKNLQDNYYKEYKMYELDELTSSFDTDTVPIRPWLPLLRNRLDTLIYPIIRRKLGQLLKYETNIQFTEYFKKALDMMNRAVSGSQNHQAGALEQVLYLTSLEKTTQPTISQIVPIAQPRMERLSF